jgi:flagellar basal body-associated protein FliL
MVKINLKKSVPLKSPEKITETPKVSEVPQKKPEPPPTTEADKILTSLDVTEEQREQEIQLTTQQEESQMSEEAEELPAKKMRFRQQEPLEVIDEKWDDFSNGGQKKTILIIIVVILLLSAGGVGIYKITDGLKSIPFFKKKQTAISSKTEPVIPPSEKPADTVPVFQQNAATNQFIYNSLQQLLSKKSNTVRYAMLILSRSNINLTLVSDSESKIAQFKNELNKEFSGLNFRTISSQKQTYNNSTLYFTDLMTKVNSSQITPATGTAPSNVTAPEAFNNQIQTIAKTHNIKLDQLKSGKRRDSQTYFENRYYLNVSGNRDNLLNFLAEIFNNHPDIRINKSSINPSNLITFSDNQLSARLNLSHINPK